MHFSGGCRLSSCHTVKDKVTSWTALQSVVELIVRHTNICAHVQTTASFKSPNIQQFHILLISSAFHKKIVVVMVYSNRALMPGNRK